MNHPAIIQDTEYKKLLLKTNFQCAIIEINGVFSYQVPFQYSRNVQVICDFKQLFV